MLLKAVDLNVIFAEVRKVHAWLAVHCEGADKTPVSLDDITLAILDIYKTKITTRLLPISSPLLKGMIEIYDGEAIITVDADENLAGSRFVFVKEACHILLLSAENATKDPGDIIEHYVHKLPENEKARQLDILCEEITKYGAIELLFPPALRKSAKERIAKGEATLFTVGEELGVPENIVEFVLRDAYIDLSERLRQEEPDNERFAAGKG